MGSIDIEDLNENSIDIFNLFDISRTFHPITRTHVFFLNAHGIFTKMDHKTTSTKFKWLKSWQNIFSAPKEIKLHASKQNVSHKRN